MRRFQPFLLTRWVCGLKYCLCFCCFSSCLAYRQRGRVRDVVYRRQTERELLITPINNLSQPQDIELGLPAACFRLRAMKPSKALVIKTQTWLSQDSEAGSSLFGDNGVFSPPSLHRLPRQPPWRILTKSFALIVCTAVEPRYPSPHYLLHFSPLSVFIICRPLDLFLSSCYSCQTAQGGVTNFVFADELEDSAVKKKQKKPFLSVSLLLTLV